MTCTHNLSSDLLVLVIICTGASHLPQKGAELVSHLSVFLSRVQQFKLLKFWVKLQVKVSIEGSNGGIVVMVSPCAWRVSNNL